MIIIYAFLIILNIILCSANPIEAQAASLWVGEKEKIINLSTTNGSYLLEIPAQYLEDIAVDNNRGVIWVATKKEVIRYTLEGQEIFRYSLNIEYEDDNEKDEEDSDDEDSDEGIVHLSLDPSDGSLWIGAKDDVIKISSYGVKLFGVKDIGPIKDLSVDISDGSCWVGLKQQAIRYSSDGIPLFTFNPGEDNEIQALAADPLSQSLWIGTEDGLMKVNKDGFDEFYTDEPSDIQDLKIDINDGSVWVVTEKWVFKYSSAGERLFSIRPCPENGDDDEEDDVEDDEDDGGGDEEDNEEDNGEDDDDSENCEGDLITLAIDPSDSTGWVAWRKTLLKLSNIGGPLFWLYGFEQIKALDIGLPKLGIDITEPLDGAIVDTPSITVKGTVTDRTAKVTVEGLEAFVAGNNFQIDNVQLNPGPNTITATATNISGISVSDSITVIYQPPLTIKILFPEDGAVFSTPRIDVTGTVSDPSASVDVNGITASVVGNNFQVQGFLLNPGINIITATATLSGISVSDIITATFQPPPLTIKIDSPVDGTIFSTSRIDITGTVSDSTAKVTVNGIKATVSGNTFTATGIPITIGDNTVTATATDEYGRVAFDVVMVNYAWLNISIIYPGDGEILSVSPIDVEGVVSDPSAYVEVNGREAEVLTDGSFITYGVRLYEGQNQITAQASNWGGQRVEDTVQVTYQPPAVPLSVSLLSPENGSIIETPYFKVTGVVTDPNATVLVNDTIAQVDEDGFYNASIYACEPPAEVPDGGTGGGQWVCTVTVTAYSKDGQEISTTSFTYTYSPSDDPLTIKITDPAHNQIVTYSPYEVYGELHDVLSSLSATVVKVNGIMATVIDGNSFSEPIPLNDGLNYITVQATNPVGHDAFDTIKVIYDPPDKPLGVTISSPLDQAIVNYSPISVFGGVTHSAAEVNVNGIWADVDIEFRSFKATAVPLSIGENLITATAWLPNDEIATDSRIVIYDPNYPSPPPPVLSTLPEYVQSSVEVSGLTLPSYKVEIFANGTSRVAVWADSNGLFKTTLSLPDEGPNHISVRTIDQYGNTSNLSNEAVVIRDTVKPSTILFFYDVAGTFPVLLVSIWVYTEPYAEVDITIDNDPDYHYHVTANEWGKALFSINLSAGQHRIEAIATDKAGNTVQVPEWYFGVPHSFYWVYNTPYRPWIDPIPNPLSETVITIEGNAYAGFEIEVYRNNELMGTVITDNRGRFKLEGVSLIPGRNIIKVRQKEGILRGVKPLYSPLGVWWDESAALEAADSIETVVDVVTAPIRPEVKIDFPMNGAITNAEFLPLRGTINDPNATLRLGGYYNCSSCGGIAQIQNGIFVSNQKIPLFPGENILWVEAKAPDGSRGVDKIKVYYKKDAQVPKVQITSPTEDQELYDQYISAAGTIDSSVQKVIINDKEASINSGAFTADMIDILSSYKYNPYYYETMLTAWAMDASGNIGHHDVPLRYKYIPAPQVFISSPLNGEIINTSPVTVTGTISDAYEVTVNGINAQIDGNTFSAQIDLTEGQNTITVIAKNQIKAKVEVISVTYSPSAPVTLQSITIDPSSSLLPFGDTLQLRAIGNYSNGEKVDLTGVCTWTSSDITIADVNYGLVTTGMATMIGSSATITATCLGLSGTGVILVTPPVLKSILIAYEQGQSYLTDNPTMTMGDALQFKAVGVYSDDSLRTLSQVTWTSSNPTIATIDTNGLATAITKGTTTITATASPLITSKTITGSTTLTVNPPPMYIFITQPADGGVINKSKTTVIGTVLTEAQEVGITVNGLLANIYGNQFVVNSVPLIEGSNVIVAKAIDSNGATTEAQITITSSPSANYIRLTSNIESGIAPIEATLTVDSNLDLTNSYLTYTYPGTIPPEVTAISSEEYRVKLTAEGIHYFTANVTGPDGNLYQDTIAITVLNRNAMDALLKSKWEGMKGKLVAEDVEGAVGYFEERSQETYRSQFTALKPILNIIANDMGQINLVNIEDDWAEYEIITIRNGISYSFHLLFVRGKDGLWKIKVF